MSRKILVSPDGDAIAIRTDAPEDSNKAWGVMHVGHGGAWVNSAAVAEWLELPVAEKVS